MNANVANVMKGILPLTGRLLIGALFAYSGFTTLLQPLEHFEFVIRLYAILPEWSVEFFAQFIPWCELILGAFLLLGYELKTSLYGLQLLVFSFLFVLGQAVFRELPIKDCGCFGGLVHLTPCQTYILDSVLFAALLALEKRLPMFFSLDSLLNKPK